MKQLLELFFVFAKIGMFTFGGGYAMIPIIEDICVERKKWITHDEMMNIAVIAESTPGPIAINCATYVGNKWGGFLGSIAATVGVVVPSFIVIYLVSTVLGRFMEIPAVENAFRGIRIGVSLLILRVAWNMAKKLPKKTLPRVIALCAFAVILVINFMGRKVSSIMLLLAALIVGLAAHALKRGGGRE